MARKPFEQSGESGEHGPERKKSHFELPRMPWNRQTDSGVYARRESGFFVGRILLQSAVAREKKESAGKRNDLQTVLQDKGVELKGLHGKKEELAKLRNNLAKGFKDFREAEKVLGYALEPFQGEKRELLLAALDDKFTEKKDKKPLKPEEERKYEEVIDELDSRTAEEKRPAMRLAAFIYLKREKLFEAEDQLNGTRQQQKDSQINVAVQERSVLELLDTSPGLADRIEAICRRPNVGDDEKARAIHFEFFSLEDPVARETLENYSRTLAKHVVDDADFERRIFEGERNIRTIREATEKAERLAESESAIAQIPKEEGARREQEALERHEIVTEE